MNTAEILIPTLHDTDRDAILDHLCACDTRLGELIREVGHCEINITRYQSLYQALLRAIVYQQLAGKAAAAIFARVQRLFVANDAPPDADPATLPFPTPEQIAAASVERLRSAGLSNAKALAVKDLAAKTLDGTVPTLEEARSLTDEELIERLTEVRGIGRWTVEMMLIFHLGRLDVLPVADYGVRKGFALTYRMRDLPKPDRMARQAEKWRPYRSVASWFMWRAIELEAARRKAEGIAPVPPKKNAAAKKGKAAKKKSSTAKRAGSRKKARPSTKRKS